MAAEESVVRQRLLAKEAPLRSLSKKFLAFATAIESGTLEKCEEIQQELLKELAAYEFGMQKARCLIDTNRQQVDEYGEMHRGIEKEMQTMQQDIEQLAVQLKEERRLREQKEQYAALSRRIQQYPSRSQTERNLALLEEQIALLNEEDAAIAAKLEQRSKCFAGFMHALQDLQVQLAEDASDAMQM
mmetsp:Transcript_28726/g.60391  ORF Transcript_28726/g.60391 Transcript_28726/m.60391 type:complete len:187 (-) Transcript_28726:630-1190(-)